MRELAASLPKLEAVAVAEILCRGKPRSAAHGEVVRRPLLFVLIECRGEAGVGECPALPLPTYGPDWRGSALPFLEMVLEEFDAAKDKSSSALLSILGRFKGHQAAKFALESALIDLALKLQGLPGKVFLQARGGALERACSVDALRPSRSELVGQARELLGLGYTRLKLKISPESPVEVLKDFRQELPDLDFALDANGSFDSFKEAVSFFSELDELQPSYIEQPFKEDELIKCRRLGDYVATPLCLDESVRSVAAAELALELGAASILSVKPASLGGLTNSLAVLELCKSMGQRCLIGGTYDGGVGRAVLALLSRREEVTDPSEVVPPPVGFEDGLGSDPPVQGSKVFVPEWVGLSHPGAASRIRASARILKELRIGSAGALL